MLKVKNISFSRDKEILKKLSFSVKGSEILGIVGPSGAGKSTLLKIISGLLDADTGNVFLDGNVILGPKDKLIAGNSEIQLVNQDFSLDLYHTVSENLRVKTSHLQKEIQSEFIFELLDLFELSDLAGNQAINLSGGEQQRLALARALSLEPKVLLLDEPFAHLDAHIKRKVITYLNALKKVRRTIFILVSHDGQEMLSIADKIAYFNDGEIKRIEKPSEFYFNPKSFHEGLFFGDLNKLQINRKEILFRPSQYEIRQLHKEIEIEVKFIKKLFYGNFTLALFKYKGKEILLLEKEDNNAEIITKIYI
jgi:ABC-type Fe3+/spermidine/putrescine transport system ATPase subunit